MINPEIINATVPSQDLSKREWRPNFLPMSAARRSEIIKIVNAVMATNFENKIIVMIAEIKTHEAPLR